LPSLDKLLYAGDVLWMMFGQPVEQAAGNMQHHWQLGKFFQDIQEWRVAVAIRILEDPIKIADGLMIVECQDQSDSGSHARTSFPEWRSVAQSGGNRGLVETADMTAPVRKIVILSSRLYRI
jgi:hypothetical protein